jgi:hypothetical protein
MRRHVQSLVLVLACLAASGCTHQNSTIFISQIDAPALTNEVCTTSSTPLVNPRWSPDQGFSYVAYFRVTNLIRSNAGDLSNDSSFVLLEEIEVALEDADGNTIDVGGINPYTVPVSGPLIPSATSGSSGSSADFFSIVIPSSYGPAIEAFEGAYVVAHIRAFGRTVGGHDVESPTFTWPILIQSGAGAVCESDAGPVDVCLPGQDGANTVISDDDPACQ